MAQGMMTRREGTSMAKGFFAVKQKAPMRGDEAEPVHNAREERGEPPPAKGKGKGMANHAKGCDCKMCKG